MIPSIDWQAPWLAPLQAAGTAAWRAIDLGQTVDRALQGMGAPYRFVAQAALPDGMAYEAFIHRTRTIPTRDNLHDLFNGLVWVTQPAIKLRLNALQATAIACDGIRTTRGALRDALTLFDENGALLSAPPTLVDALRARDWRALFITHRARWREARLVLFGHALLEKLATAPRKPITAHVLVGDPLALTAEDWTRKPFLPLPVLGVPGWWPPNEDPTFYDDAQVFRPRRR